MSDESNLSFTQRLRKQFVTELLDGDKIRGDVVNDAKMGKTFLSALKDMDAQELGLMRLALEEDTAAQDRDLVMQQNQILQNIHRVVGNPFERVEGNSRVSATGEVDVAALPELNLVEGQMDKGQSTMVYEDFMPIQKALEEERGK